MYTYMFATYGRSRLKALRILVNGQTHLFELVRKYCIPV
jgi:hypothetical protein